MIIKISQPKAADESTPFIEETLAPDCSTECATMCSGPGGDRLGDRTTAWNFNAGCEAP